MADDPEVDYEADASQVLRSLSGGRWVWPPVRVRERYPLHAGRCRLTGRPVREIVEVRDRKDDGLIPEADYELLGSFLQVLDRPAVCEIEVYYEYGAAPPSLIQKAIRVLAAEFQLADTNSSSCRLPERVTSIQRQGVSWTLIDPMDFLDNNRTGIYEVDLAIASMYGTKVRRRARVFSPEHPPPDRVEVTEMPTPP